MRRFLCKNRLVRGNHIHSLRPTLEWTSIVTMWCCRCRWENWMQFVATKSSDSWRRCVRVHPHQYISYDTNSVAQLLLRWLAHTIIGPSYFSALVTIDSWFLDFCLRVIRVSVRRIFSKNSWKRWCCFRVKRLSKQLSKILMLRSYSVCLLYKVLLMLPLLEKKLM